MRTYLSALILLCMTFAMSAESTCYYSGNRQIMLYDNPTKAIIRHPKDSCNYLDDNSSIIPLTTISCNTYDLTVIEKNDSASFESIRKSIPKRSEEFVFYPCYVDEEGRDMIPTSYIYVELRTSADIAKLRKMAAQYQCQIIKQNKFLSTWYTLQMSANSTGDAVSVARDLAETGLFANSVPSFIVDLSISYDPRIYEQWGLYNSEFEDIDISVSEAWNYATGKGITVAVIDLGIDLQHEDLAENIHSLSFDAASGTSPSIIHTNRGVPGHGTHCAGIIGAVRNNNLGISGVAYDAKLMSVSVDFSDPDVEAQLADAINWAWENGADVISCSWNCWAENPMIKQAIDNAATYGRDNKGCVIVCSSGNGLGSMTFPSTYGENVIAVGNIEKNGMMNFWTCGGDNLLACAPGTKILSTTLDDTYDRLSGTSMACPHVSGVVALMLEINPDLASSDIQEIIARSATKIGHLVYNKTKKYGTWHEMYGYGLVNAS